VVKAEGTRGAARTLLKGIGLLVPYATVVVWRALDCLYILQLERYNPERYQTWLRGHRGLLVSRMEVSLQLTLFVLGVVFGKAAITGPILLALWVVTGFPILRRYRSLQVSQRLQWTARAARVSVVAFGLVWILLLWAITLVGTLVPEAPLLTGLVAGGIGGMALTGFFMPAIVFWAARATAPLERRLARRFLARAACRMQRYPGRVVGITGSYGKTSTKYVVADLLATRYRVFKTPAGVNSTMGITRVIREELTDDREVFVVEMSAYGPGEIREVCDLVHPSVGILTAVGVQHLERFGTPERIAEAKYELIAALPAGSPAVINADDPVCLRLAARARAEGKRVLLYGFGEGIPDLAVRGSEVTVSPRGSRFRVTTWEGQTEVFETLLLGRWNLSNILAGIGAGLASSVPLAAMREAVAALHPAPGRLEIRAEGGLTRILDVANANPRGAEMALEVLQQFSGGSRILITPGMVELGAIEAEENRRFGEKAAAVCDYAVLVGPKQTQPIREGLLAKGFSAERILIAPHADAVADLLAGIVKPGDILLYENRLPDTYLEVGS